MFQNERGEMREGDPGRKETGFTRGIANECVSGVLQE